MKRLYYILILFLFLTQTKIILNSSTQLTCALFNEHQNENSSQPDFFSLINDDCLFQICRQIHEKNISEAPTAESISQTILNKTSSINEFFNTREMLNLRTLSHSWDRYLTKLLQKNNLWVLALPNLFVKKSFIHPTIFTFKKQFPLHFFLDIRQHPLFFAIMTHDTHLFNTLLDQGWDFFWKFFNLYSLIDWIHFYTHPGNPESSRPLKDVAPYIPLLFSNPMLNISFDQGKFFSDETDQNKTVQIVYQEKALKEILKRKLTNELEHFFKQLKRYAEKKRIARSDKPEKSKSNVEKAFKTLSLYALKYICENKSDSSLIKIMLENGFYNINSYVRGEKLIEYIFYKTSEDFRIESLILFLEDSNLIIPPLEVDNIFTLHDEEIVRKLIYQKKFDILLKFLQKYECIEIWPRDLISQVMKYTIRLNSQKAFNIIMNMIAENLDWKINTFIKSQQKFPFDQFLNFYSEWFKEYSKDHAISIIPQPRLNGQKRDSSNRFTIIKKCGIILFILFSIYILEKVIYNSSSLLNFILQ
jgi:hypothetical protein